MSAAPYTGLDAGDDEIGTQPADSFRRVLEASPDSLSIMSAVRDPASGEIIDFKFDYVNPAGAVMQGVSPDEVMSKSLLERHPGAISSGLFRTYVRAVETGEPYDEEIPYHYEAYHGWYRIAVVKHDDGVLVTASDVSRRRHAQERTRSLLAIATRLSGAVTPAEVADVVFEDGCLAMRADGGTLALLRSDGDANEFETIRTGGFEPEVAEKFHFFPLNAGRPLSDAVLTRRPIFLETAAAWESAYGPELTAFRASLGYEALACAPIIAGSRPLGGLAFNFRGPQSFDEDTRTFVETLARLCAQALERSRSTVAEQRMGREADRADRRVAFLASASAELAKSLDVEETLQTIAALAVPELAEWCIVEVVGFREDGTKTVFPVAIQNEDPEMQKLGWEVTNKYPLKPENEFGSIKILKTEEPDLVVDVPPGAFDAVAVDEEHLRLLNSIGFRSIVQVPLKSQGELVGVLTLARTTRTEERFGPADLDLALELAARAGVAFEKAKLYADERSARREAEEARRVAEEASRAKSQFLAVMSHELRTPLNAIGGYSELLEMGVHGEMTEGQLEALRRIRRSQQHLLSVIDDLLSYARLETGKLEYRFTSVPVDETLAELEALVTPQLNAKGLSYDYCRIDPPVTVWADRDKLEQIIVNLLTNAIKFTVEGGIEVKCDVEPTVVRVRIRDTGVGMPTDKLSLIFDPFVQLNAGLTRTSSGSGLGLAISRELARGMRGDIEVESEPGKGSMFTVTMPRSEGGLRSA